MAQQSTSFLTDIEMVNKRRWKQVITDLVSLCGRLIDYKGLRGVTSSVITTQASASSEKTGPNVDIAHRNQEIASILKNLREVTASIDCPLLEFEKVDPTNLWANTFCTPIMEYPDMFEMSIFGFRFVGHSIPLHDHPNMYGFIRPLQGRIRVSSYSWLNPSDENELISTHDGKTITENGGQKNVAEKSPGFVLRPARYEGQLILSAATLTEKYSESKVVMLEPSRVNVHMIEALDDGSAFFDLLVPGYHSENRPCKYYNVIESKKTNHAIGDIVWLEGSEDTPEQFTMQRI